MVFREMPAVRWPGAAGNRRLGHVPRFSVVSLALSVYRVLRPAVRPGPHEDVAAGLELHRRKRARGASSIVCALHLYGVVRPEAAALRHPVSAVPRPRPDREGWRQ